MKVGYARVSTKDQTLKNQISRPAETDCELFFSVNSFGRFGAFEPLGHSFIPWHNFT